MKEIRLSGPQLNSVIAHICVDAGLYTFDRMNYLKPYIVRNDDKTMGLAFPAGTSQMSKLPPKYTRESPLGLFDPVNDARIGLPIIEHFSVSVGNCGYVEMTKCYGRLSGGHQYGDTYLEAGLRAVVSLYYGANDIPAEILP